MSYGPMGTTDRLCDWPSCPDLYDALAVMEGKASAPGWRMHPTFGLDMCGRHVPLTLGDDPSGGGPHCPALDRETLSGVRSCGSALTVGQSTLGQIKDAYRVHLIEVAVAA
ncbi:hypothetical protein NE236_42015 [Actinoallomurus purpureus]|uniref:hypothetical protein n=1 Tax=Actinoallomurus purpureus TaxID=478114 RepID=UPI00209352E1|nr:hypothetical protein [Actinoallomurus purpureus]MCO6011548.1 hypothetical protein [Actinoallomurus purpureus]